MHNQRYNVCTPNINLDKYLILKKFDISQGLLKAELYTTVIQIYIIILYLYDAV